MTASTDSLFTTYITQTIAKEGGARYTNDPADAGGETKWGVTSAMARSAGYTGAMADMPEDVALNIYKVFFWQQPGFDAISVLNGTLGAMLLDLGVNNGTSWPSKWLQRSLNVLNGNQSNWKDIPVDGQAGAMTRLAVSSLIKMRGNEGIRVLCASIRALAGVRYIELAEADRSQARFEFGWLSQRAFPAQ